jgi:hypothetical protein
MDKQVVVCAKKGTQKQTLYISGKEVNPFQTFINQFAIEPGSLLNVGADIVLQKTKLIRHIIKQLDLILAVDGLFTIKILDLNLHSGYLRSRSQVKYEFALATNGRYRLLSAERKEKYIRLKYQKNNHSIPSHDSIDKWTFGIVTNGQKNDWVKELIHSIEKQNIPNYEILISGPNPYEKDDTNENNHFKLVGDVTLQNDIRPPLCHKKNRIIEQASFNNICIMHDRYLLPDNWFEQMKNYGNYFEALCLKTHNPQGQRFGVDWMKFDPSISGRRHLNRALLYNEWHKDAIIPGGSFIIKKNLFENFMLDERLHWDEMEDMQLSRMAVLNGLLIQFDPNNYYISRQVRHGVKKYDAYQLKFKKPLNFIKAAIKARLKYRNEKSKV